MSRTAFALKHINLPLQQNVMILPQRCLEINHSCIRIVAMISLELFAGFRNNGNELSMGVTDLRGTDSPTADNLTN